MADLIIFFTLLVLGYVFGRMAESKHFKSIIEREKQYANVLTFSERLPPPGLGSVEANLVVGNVVVSIDYFKKVVAGLRSIVGGRVSTYETLIERARREAVLRMKAEAIAKGANHIINVKLETSSIAKGAGRQIGSVEVCAYGTALTKVA